MRERMVFEPMSMTAKGRDFMSRSEPVIGGKDAPGDPGNPPELRESYQGGCSARLEAAFQDGAWPEMAAPSSGSRAGHPGRAGGPARPAASGSLESLD